MNLQRSCIGLLFVIALLLPRPGRALSITVLSEGHGVRNFIDHHVPGDPYATTDVDQTQSNNQGGASLSNDLGYGATYGSSIGSTLYAEASADGTNLAALGFDSVSAESDASGSIHFEITGTSGTVDLVVSETYSVTDVSTDPTAGFAQPGTDTLHMRNTFLYQNGQRILGTSTPSGDLVFRLVAGAAYALDVSTNATAGVKLSTGHAHATTTLSYALSAVPVPEPGTGVLLGTALAALGLGERCRRHRLNRS